jgi:hypothetical protein
VIEGFVQGMSVRKPGGVYVLGCEMWDMGYGLWDIGGGMWEVCQWVGRCGRCMSGVGNRHIVQGVTAILWHCHQVATGSSDTINIFGFRLSRSA